MLNVFLRHCSAILLFIEFLCPSRLILLNAQAQSGRMFRGSDLTFSTGAKAITIQTMPAPAQTARNPLQQPQQASASRASYKGT
jgi:hypothetical protein